MSKRPVILVFDDQWATRESVLKSLIGDQVDLREISHFTRESLNRGEAGVMITPELVAKADPAVIITDLSIVPSLEGDWGKGVKMLGLLRRIESLKSVPVLVVSDFANDERAQDQLRRVGVSKENMFYWQDLTKKDSREREKFRMAIEKVLEIKTSED
jgi:hypothetical protein